MARLCPLCNGMTPMHVFCLKCGRRMTEEGRKEDIKGQYSPYMDRESFSIDMNNDVTIGDHLCVHLYYCEMCGTWEHRAV